MSKSHGISYNVMQQDKSNYLIYFSSVPSFIEEDYPKFLSICKIG